MIINCPNNMSETVPLDTLFPRPMGISVNVDNCPMVPNHLIFNKIRTCWDFRTSQSIMEFPGLQLHIPVDYMIQFFLNLIVKIDKPLSLPFLLSEIYDTPNDYTLFEQYIIEREDVLLAFLFVDLLHISTQDALDLSDKLIGKTVRLDKKILRVKWYSGHALYTAIPDATNLSINSGLGLSYWYQVANIVSLD